MKMQQAAHNNLIYSDTIHENTQNDIIPLVTGSKNTIYVDPWGDDSLEVKRR